MNDLTNLTDLTLGFGVPAGNFLKVRMSFFPDFHFPNVKSVKFVKFVKPDEVDIQSLLLEM